MAEKPKRGSHRLPISPTYLALICCLIIVLFIIGGFFEVDRTRRSLRGILENQGATLLRGLEREIQNIISVIDVMEEVPGGHLLNITSSVNFFALEDVVVDYLLEIGRTVDKEEASHDLSPGGLKTLAGEKGLDTIEILNGRASGKDLSPYEALLTGSREIIILPFKKPKPDKDDRFSVAIKRREGEGIVVVSVDYPGMKKLRRTFAIQNVLENAGLGEGVQYVFIFDLSLHRIAQTRREGLVKTWDLSLPQGLQGEGKSKSQFRSLVDGQEVLEVIGPLHLGGELYGTMLVGLSTQGIRAILSLSKGNIIISVGVLLALGVTGVTLIYVNQNRHLRKIEEMEGRVQTAERLLSLGKLGAGVAHEIRNPLNAIAMAIQRLGSEFRPRGEEREEEYHRIVRVIRDEIGRLNQIVEQFVLFSKPYRLNLAPVSPGEILENISILFAEEARANSVEIHTEIEPMLPLLLMDKERITQALINIVTNGLNAMEGGGKLTMRAKLDGRDWIKVVISDTGRGIPEEEIESAFDYSYTTGEKGLGLGLPIAHKIIEEHGGRITIESRVGRGTDVSIFLPVRVTAS
jgi:signal transduction histidine kinase